MVSLAKEAPRPLPQGEVRQWHRFWIIPAIVFAASTVAFAAEVTTSAISAHIVTSSGKKIVLQLELAATPEAREQGLMKRKTLKPHDGMAFFFPTITPQKFWMKDTLIPLDILFVGADNRISYIAYGEPKSMTPVGPDTSVSSAVEIEGGRAKREGIKVGDRLIYEIATTPQNMAK